MPEIDVKLSQIAPSATDADTSTQIVSVQSGALDKLFSVQQLNKAPFVSNTSSTATSPTPRSAAARWSDWINVKDFGAKGDFITDDTAAIQNAFNFNVVATNGSTATSNATLHFASVPSWVIPGMGVADTTALGRIFPGTIVTGVTATTVTISPGAQGTVLSGDMIMFGGIGRVYFPPGSYKVTGPIYLWQANPGFAQYTTQGIIIEGNAAGTSQILSSSPGFNGFIFDSMNATHVNANSNPWAIRNLNIRNVYIPTQIYRNNVVAAGAWAQGAGSITVTNASSTGIVAGAIVFSSLLTGTFGQTPSGGGGNQGGVPAYIGYVTNVVVGGSTTTWTIGDANGAQIPSSNFGTGTADGLTVVQGFFANSTFTTGVSTTVTMLSNNPGLDAGNYYVWNWSQVTANKQPFPTAVGITSSANWVGTTLTFLNGLKANINSTSATDLLVLSPISGAIRQVGSANPVIENCTISGIIGVTTECIGIPTADNVSTGVVTFGATLRNCNFTNPLSTSAAIGQHHMYVTQASLVQNCDVSGGWVGCRMQGVNPTFYGSRAELCAYAFVLGGIINGGSGGINTACPAPVIAQTECEGSWIANILTDTSTCWEAYIYNFDGNNFHGNNTYGFYLGKGFTTSSVFINCQNSSAPITATGWGGYWNPSFKGIGSPCAWFVPASIGSVPVTFISCIGSAVPGPANLTVAAQTAGQQAGIAWRMPLSLGVEFINCNNSPNILTFSQLPTLVTMTGRITNGAGGAGTQLVFTAGTFGTNRPTIGSAITGAGVSSGTIITSNLGSGALNAVFIVNNSQLIVAGSSISYAGAQDGDEYLISDSSVPYLTAGVSNVGKAVTGGGTNHVKVRWDASQSAWILV